jgi:hypothetical protein
MNANEDVRGTAQVTVGSAEQLLHYVLAYDI